MVSWIYILFYQPTELMHPHLLLYCCCLLSIKLRFPSTSLIMKGNDRNDALFDRENQIKYDCLISNWKCWFLVWKRCVRVRLMILFYWGHNLCWIAVTWWHFGPLHMNTVLKIVVCWQNRWMNRYQKLPAEHTRWGNAGKKIKKDYPCKWWKVKRVYQSVTAGCRLKAWVTVCQLFFLLLVVSFWNEMRVLKSRCGQQHVFFNDTDASASRFSRYCTVCECFQFIYFKRGSTAFSL